mgnify:CR=1 FL=1
MTGDRKRLERARQCYDLYWDLSQGKEDPVHMGPKTIPETRTGRAFGIPMIILNVTGILLNGPVEHLGRPLHQLLVPGPPGVLQQEPDALDVVARVHRAALGVEEPKAHFADPEYGEWYGYLRRDGLPTQPSTKGSTFKGPFHLMLVLSTLI